MLNNVHSHSLGWKMKEYQWISKILICKEHHQSAIMNTWICSPKSKNQTIKVSLKHHLEEDIVAKFHQD